MKHTPFETQLAPRKCGIVGGFAGGPGVNLRADAESVFKGEVPGPWLCCYMIRRFGWPNAGSDDYKELCSWVLTTPMKGLFLSVAPYLGGSNLHFAVRFTASVRSGLYADPGRAAYHARRDAAIRRWWKRTGRTLYVWGLGKRVGDEDELVKAANEDEEKGEVFGLWKRTPQNCRARGRTAFSPGGKKEEAMALWFLGELIKEKHPEVKFPKMTKRECERRRSRYHLRVAQALRATMRDLLRPTNVRDISFNPFGDIERTDAAKPFADLPSASYFEGAGYAPSYWYDPKNRNAIRKEPR